MTEPSERSSFTGDDTTIFATRSILTMDSTRPRASAVAVRDGRILGLGSVEELRRWFGEKARLDTTFEDKTILPGLIDPHMHALMTGLNWRGIYIGFHERITPTGATAPGSRSKGEALERLKAELALKHGSSAVTVWGYDPALLGGKPVTASELDAVTGDVPVVVRNTSGHINYANTAALKACGIDRTSEVEGVVKDLSGEPTGELQELRAMSLVAPLAARPAQDELEQALANAAAMAQRTGCTSVTDWAFGGQAGAFEAYRHFTAGPDCNVRFTLAPFYSYLLAKGGTMEGGLDVYRGLKESENEKLDIGAVKFMVDGSTQGFTADLRWPGYHNGAPNGIQNTSAEELTYMLRTVHEGGLQATIHANGDGAAETALQALQAVLSEAPRPDHRHRLEHLQMATTEQYGRMAAMGVGGVIFPVHIYFWGDFHYANTMGPARANRMNSARTAGQSGVRFSFHSDSPVTPVGPLFSAWCAVNRRTSSGRVLGEEECVSVEEALRAITIDAAHLLHQDADKGSIEIGKLADFAVLDEDPLAVDPARLKEIGVWGTVLAGVKHASAPGN